MTALEHYTEQARLAALAATPRVTWPDLSNHSKAWFLAKQELGPHALTQEIATRAEIIRRQLENR